MRGLRHRPGIDLSLDGRVTSITNDFRETDARVTAFAFAFGTKSTLSSTLGWTATYCSRQTLLPPSERRMWSEREDKACQNLQSNFRQSDAVAWLRALTGLVAFFWPPKPVMVANPCQAPTVQESAHQTMNQERIRSGATARHPGGTPTETEKLH